ncbi:hypothetical protein OK074_5057 [Actinobacteria bacterium OK074]|nr:hypothetical protein OK074_5057 [Actinobacteria bacterium OK074]
MDPYSSDSDGALEGVPTADAAGCSDIPLELRLPAPTEVVGQAFPHRDPLSVAGIPVVCTQCSAREDWLILMVEDAVYVRCRCGNEWREPELTPMWFEASKGGPPVEYQSSGEAVVQKLGFDGTFRGIYF